MVDKIAWGSLAWAIASAVLNTVLQAKTPEQWEAFVAANPRGAALVKILRKLGCDLPGVVRELQTIFSRRAQ